jgi:hypothetical protein
MSPLAHGPLYTSAVYISDWNFRIWSEYCEITCASFLTLYKGPKVNRSIQQSHFSEAKSHSHNQEIHLLWNPRFIIMFKILPHDSVLSQINSVHILFPSYLS